MVIFSRGCILLAAAAIAMGCKSQEAQVVGTWANPNADVRFTPEKNFQWTNGGINFIGTWKIDDDDVVMTRTKYHGIAITQVKGLISAAADRAGYEALVARQAADDDKADYVKSAAADKANLEATELRELVEDLDKPIYMKLSASGKSMTTDRARDKNSGSPQTLTWVHE